MNSLFSQRRFASHAFTAPLAVLDIGTSKITCFIAAPADDESHSLMHIQGVGNVPSEGIRNGAVVDLAAAENAIRKAVSSAESRAGITIDNVIVGISPTGLQSHTYNVTEPLGGFAVSDDILATALHTAREHCQSDKTEILHAIPVAYKIDGGASLTDPRGMQGDELCVTIHVMTAPVAQMRNVLMCIEKCHLHVERLIVAPYASALACLADDEAELGTIVIDMGAGTTGYTVFYENMPIHSGILPIGGHKITTDIAHGLSISTAQAERIKRLHGSAWSSANDLHESFELMPSGEKDEEARITVDRASLSRIIRPRIEEIFEMLLQALEHSSLHHFAATRIILTGGAAMLTGASDVAARILEKQVRLGVPLRLSGLPESMNHPAFSASAGLMTYMVKQHYDRLAPSVAAPILRGSLGQLGQWLKRNF